MLWTGAEVAQATGGDLAGGAGWTATGVSIDSRTLVPGDLFVALQGPSFDGHDFVAAAFAAGASAAIVARSFAHADGRPVVQVPDTFAALQALGAAARARSQARFVAVTGSVGKTGTKEALRLALEAQAPTFASRGNLNNHWGVPLSLARMPRGVTYGVFELGMNHAGEIGPLSRQVRPEVAVITNVEAVHLEFFASVEGIADAKAEIFEGVAPSGAAVLNRDSPHFARLLGAAEARGIGRIVGFGRNGEAEARLVDCSLQASGSTVTASILGERLDYTLPVPGEHHVLNSLAVLAAVKLAGADAAAAAETLAKLAPLEGRGRRRTVATAGGSFELIDESYNASPVATRAALAVLGRQKTGPGGRRIAVLGDMLELGPEGRRLHTALAEDAVGAGVDLVFTAGPLMGALADALPAARRGAAAPSSEALLPQVVEAVRPGDVVLVKGSLGSRMAPIVKALAALEGHERSDAVLPRAANGH